MKIIEDKTNTVIESILSEFFKREETIKVLKIIAKTNAMINSNRFDFYREISKR